MSHVEKFDLRLLWNKTETFFVSVTYLILRFAIFKNKIQQTNKTKINHANDNQIKFEVSLHFWRHLAYCAAVEAEVSFSEQGAARQPLLLDSHRWQGIFQNDYTAFAIGMTDSIAAAMLPELP